MITSYDALKKLFPSTSLDPSYHSTQNDRESSSLLPTHRNRAAKYATPEQFREALDRERTKVEAFYRSKEEDLHHTLSMLEEEVLALEDRDLGTDDVIKEEDEDEEDEDGDNDEGEAREGEGLLSSSRLYPKTSTRPAYRPRTSTSIFNRLGKFAQRRKSAIKTNHEADILEASFAPSTGRPRRRSLSTSRDMGASVSTIGTHDEAQPSPLSPVLHGRVPSGKRNRPNSEMESSEDGTGTGTGHERRTSVSSNSSHEHDFWQARRRHLSLGLVQTDPASVPAAVKHFNGDAEQGHGGVGLSSDRPVFVWTANNDYGTVIRIGFKKRISAVWLDAYALKQYVDLNLTAFEKILKK